MFARTKNLVISAVAAFFLISATGCTTDTDIAEPPGSQTAVSPTSASPSPSPTPTAKPTPTPIPASSNGPAKNWPVPKMPAVAKEKSEAGVAAFTKYYFELVDYTLLTYDTQPLKAVTEHSCYLCAKQLIDPADSNRKKGGWHVGGTTITTPTFAQIVGTDGVSGFTFEREKTDIYRPSGEFQGTISATTRPVAGTFTLTFVDGWKVVDVQFVDPDGK